MKLLKTTYILLATLVFAGCDLTDDLSKCPPAHNTVLRFFYDGDPDRPVSFAEAVDGVTLLVFDGGGQLVETIDAPKSALGSDNSYKMTLDPGDYTVVCWANATNGHTQFAINSITDGRLKNPCRQTTADNAIDTDDPLYFGTTDITVVDKQQNTGDIQLEGAHVKIDVCIKGFGQANDPASYPIVEIVGDIHDYGIMKDRLGPVSELYRPAVEHDSGRGTMCSKLNIMLFDDDNNLVLSVIDPATGNVAHTIDLEQFMLNNNISVENRNEAVLDIMIEFTGLGVTVTLPDWESDDLNPSAH